MIDKINSFLVTRHLSLVTVFQDLRYGLRMMGKNPGFSIVAVLTLALGIGANTSIFSVVNAVLLRPLPYPDPGQLVQVRKSVRPNSGIVLGGGEYVGGNEYIAWKKENQVCSQISAYSDEEMTLTGVAIPERLACGMVTANFFPLLGVQPFLGRNFLEEEDRPGGERVVILGYGLWMRRFGGDPDLLGKTLTLNGKPYTAVGVLPASFQFPEPFELWLPMALDESQEMSGTGGAMRISLVSAIARLKPDISLERAQVELDGIAQRLMQSRLPNPSPRQEETGPGTNPSGGALPIQMPFPNPIKQELKVSEPQDQIMKPQNDRVFPPSEGEIKNILGPAGGPPAQRVQPEQPVQNMITKPLTSLSQKPGITPRDPGPQFDTPLSSSPLGDGGRIRLVPLHEQIVGNIRPALWVLLGAVGFVLLIACVNVANLLLSRAVRRQKEVAIRSALGAGRLRIIRMLLTESVALSILGGGLGLLFAYWGIDLLRGFGAQYFPKIHVIEIDGGVLSFTVSISLLTGALFGLAPALLSSRLELFDTLKKTTEDSSGRIQRHRFRDILIVSEVALALALMIGAGLLVKSFYLLRHVDPGFRPENVLTLSLRLPETKYPQASQQKTFYQQVLDRVQSLPGVRHAGLTDHLPLTGYSMMLMGIQIENQTQSEQERKPPVSLSSVSWEYFRALGIPLRLGRFFTQQDRDNSPAVAIVNEAFVRDYFKNESPVGKRIVVPGLSSDRAEIVGVVGDVRQSGLESEMTAEIYIPFAQTSSSRMTLAVSTVDNPIHLVSDLRGIVRETDPDLPVESILTMEQRIAESIAPRRLHVLLLGSFASLALLLSAVGIFGVLSYSVSQRTHEIGIRMALGGGKGDVLRMVIKQGMTLTLFGIGAGLILSLAVTRYLSNMLFAVQATDFSTFAFVSVLLAMTALLACYIPARRAAKVDPMTALRYE